jgi:xylulokinase
MQLLDVPNRCWSDEVLGKLEIDKILLGKVYESPEVTGTVTAEASKLTGLKKGTIVVGGAGDNAAAAVGTGIVSDGKAFTTIGTSGVVYAHLSEIAIEPAGRVHTFCCAVPGAWHVMGVTQSAGLSLQWFRNNFCESEVNTAREMGVDPYYLMDKEAERIPIGCEKLIYLPYLMGERTPHLDPSCRGVFFGLSAIHTKAHMLRSVMEGVSYSLRDCVELLRGMGVFSREMLICGGGAASNLWGQMLADLYNCKVKTLVSGEGPALGVAILAGVGAGIYESVEDGCDAIIKTNPPQSPIEENTAKYENYYSVYRGLYPALKESFRHISHAASY